MSEIPEEAVEAAAEHLPLRDYADEGVARPMVEAAYPAIREQVLADVVARIEELVHKEQGFDNADMEYGYGRGLAESIRALAALTQPENKGTSNRPESAVSNTLDGGGAATPRGARGADLEGEGVYEAVYACLDACGGTMGSTVLHFLADLDERGFRVVRADTEPTPYAKAFRERVCPVPEFPGIEKEES